MIDINDVSPPSQSLPSTPRLSPLAPAPSTLETVPINQTSAHRSAQRTIRAGMIAISVFFSLFIVLAGFIPIGGAVIGSGTLIVENSSKTVQHPTGGVVGQILVKEGDEVKAGQLLIRLDATVAEARQASVTEALDRQLTRVERLIAERDRVEVLEFSNALLTRLMSHPKGAAAIQSETDQFIARRNDREGTRTQLKERLAQSSDLQRGLSDELAALDNQIASMTKEVERLRALAAKKVVTQSVLAEAERKLLQMQGDRASVASQLATEKGHATEIKLQQDQIDQNFLTQVTSELYDAQRQAADLDQQEAVALDTLNRVDIVAPQAGIVHNLIVHTVGGVIQPAETLMTIVPENDTLVGEVRISPADVDQIHPEQEATVHFSAFDRATTPTATGLVKAISADLEEDKRSGALYYSVRIELPPEEVAKIGNLKLIPGMPIEVFIKTSDRTMISYLMKPLTDQIERAFRD